MDTNKILQADVLDIIFDNRNKAYGAYELRKNYHKRLKRSMMIAATLVMVTVSAPIIASMFNKPIIIDKTYEEQVKITEVIIPKEEIKHSEPPKFDPVEVEVNTVINTTPEIVDAVDVKVGDLPPTKEELKGHQSGVVDYEGETVEIGTIPSEGTGHETVVIPEEKKEEPEDILYTETDISQSPEYPGGEEELMTYLSNNIKYPTRAVSSETEGRVVLGFVVDKNGNIDEIKILKGIGDGCDEEAIRVVNQMPKWKPGKNNGKPVNVYFNLPITFELK